MCQAYRRQYGFNAISLMPTNLYGPGDDFDPVTSHVIPALIRRIHEAKAHGDARVTLWGTGRPRREFMYVDDLARAVLHLMQLYDDEAPINVGTGTDLSIGELARLVCDVVGYDGQLVLDASKPDGTPRKLLDVTRINSLGWRADIGLVEGIRSTYEWCLEHESWERSPDRDLSCGRNHLGEIALMEKLPTRAVSPAATAAALGRCRAPTAGWNVPRLFLCRRFTGNVPTREHQHRRMTAQRPREHLCAFHP